MNNFGILLKGYSFLLFISVWPNCFAQTSDPDSIVAFFTRGEVKLDGILNEDAWTKAMPPRC